MYLPSSLCSENDAAAALKRVPEELSSHLVLWTSAEQQAIGLAFEKVSICVCTFVCALMYCEIFATQISVKFTERFVPTNQ